MANDLEQWYFDIPIVTRTFLTLSTVTALAVTFDLLSPLSLYLNYSLIWEEWQMWRLATCFLFFDRLSVNFVLHLYFLYFYCRRLEEHAFHGRTSDFLYMLLLGAGTMLCVAPFIDLPFLSHSLVLMVLYMWARRNPYEQLHLYGLFTIGAAYLPYVLLALGVMMGQDPLVDLLGIVVGHVYYFAVDVVPVAYDKQFVRTPAILRIVLGEMEEEEEFIEEGEEEDDDEEDDTRVMRERGQGAFRENHHQERMQQLGQQIDL